MPRDDDGWVDVPAATAAPADGWVDVPASPPATPAPAVQPPMMPQAPSPQAGPPQGASRTEVELALAPPPGGFAALPAPPAQEPLPWGHVFGRAMHDGFVNNLLAIPSVMGDALSVNPLRTAAALRRGEAPAPVIGSTPRVTMQDLRAARDVAGQISDMAAQGQLNVGERFAAAQEAQAAHDARLAGYAPVEALTGGLAGDALTLVTGRAPLARRIATAEKTATGAPAMARSAFMDKSWRKTVQRALESKTVRRLRRGLGRAGETGLEATVLAALKGEDPAFAAALGAGGQAAGSVALSLAKIPISSKGVVATGAKIAGTALALTSFIHLAKQFLPGGNDYIVESSDKAFAHLKHGIIVGALAGLGGFGRLRGSKLAEEMPAATDAIAALPRGAAITALNDYFGEQERGEAVIEPVLGALATSPELFTPNERRQLERAMQSETISLGQTIQKMRKRPAFEAKIADLIGDDDE